MPDVEFLSAINSTPNSDNIIKLGSELNLQTRVEAIGKALPMIEARVVEEKNHDHYHCLAPLYDLIQLFPTNYIKNNAILKSHYMKIFKLAFIWRLGEAKGSEIFF